MHIPITKSASRRVQRLPQVGARVLGTIMSHAAIGDAGSSAAGNACDACMNSACAPNVRPLDLAA